MAENKKVSQDKPKTASVHNYHELQMSDMKFDAHSAFIAPTHRKILRVRHMCTLIMRCFRPLCRNEKQTKEGGGGGELPPTTFATGLK